MVCASVVHVRLRARAIGTREVGRCQWHWRGEGSLAASVTSTGVPARALGFPLLTQNGDFCRMPVT